MSAAIRGKQVAFTGTFENMNRAAVVAKAKAAGAIVLGRGASMSKNIDVLVTGDSNVGFKKAQAKHLGIQILPASTFTKFIGSGGAARMARASAAPMATRRQQIYQPQQQQRRASRVVMEEDFEQEEEEEMAMMPWEKTAQKEEIRQPRRAAPMRAPMKFKTVRPAPVRAIAPAVRRIAAPAYVPFWDLKGRTVAFTGSFDQLKKSEATVMAERNGANVHTGMGHQIDILVCGKGSEAKRMLAKKKGILAVSESTFIAACRK